MPAKKPASLKRQGRETPRETPRTRTAPNGGLLRSGNPGNRGGGRTKDEFKQRMRELSSSDQALAYLEECLRGDHGYKAHTSAMAFAAEHGYGKATETVEHTGAVEVHVRIAREGRRVTAS
jgi:hypothetical protein